MKSTCHGLSTAMLVSAGIMAAGSTMANEQAKPAPLVIQNQGSFAVGGTMLQNPGAFDAYKPAPPAGQTFRGDHAYAFYQIPANARKLPLVLWHGAGQFSKTWETTADGREDASGSWLDDKGKGLELFRFVADVVQELRGEELRYTAYGAEPTGANPGGARPSPRPSPGGREGCS